MANNTTNTDPNSAAGGGTTQDNATFDTDTGAKGKTVIADGVVAKIAGIAVREVDGVDALGGGAARAVGAIRDAIGSTDLSQGVSVEVGEKQVAADITIVAKYPYSLQKIAEDVRSAVTRAIEDLVGLEVTEVNVTINDVHVPDNDAEHGTDSGAQVQ